MPFGRYRVSFLIAVFSIFSVVVSSESFAQTVEGDLPSYSLRGANGDDSRNGEDAPQERPRSPGRGGRDGGDARPPASRRVHGQDGGDLILELSQSAGDVAEGYITISGRYRMPGQRRWKNLREAKKKVGDRGVIEFDVSGGDGGRGGNAGRGQPGANGMEGQQAKVISWDPTSPHRFQFKPAEDGTPAGPGGNAGEASDGGAAGNGGTIVVRVPEDQTHLLYLVSGSPNISAGQPGRAGTPVRSNPAESGRPGKGGIGVSELEITFQHDNGVDEVQNLVQKVSLKAFERKETISWKVKEFQRDERNLPMRDANGNYIRITKTIQETYYIPRRVPSGNRGATARPGSLSRQRVRDGSSARDGSFSIEVVAADGSERAYQSRFDVSISQIVLRQESADGVLQPFERGELLVTLKNTGGMPSPAGRVQLTAQDGTYVDVDETASFSVPALQPGETLTTPVSIPFEISAVNFPVMVSDEQIVVSGRAGIASSLPDIRRDISSRSLSVDIGLPVTITGFRGLSSLRAGEAGRFEFDLRNTSSQDLPGHQVVAALIRYIQRSESGSPSDLVFVDEEGNRIDLSNPRSITQKDLKKGESRKIILKVGVPSTLEAGFEFGLQSRAEVGSMYENDDRSSELIHIAFNVQVAETLNVREDSDLLFVYQASTRVTTYEALLRQFSELGLQVDSLDLGVEGVLDLLEKVKDDKNLQDFFANKVFVIAYPSHDNLINFEQLRHAVSLLGSTILFVDLNGLQSSTPRWGQALVSRVLERTNLTRNTNSDIVRRVDLVNSIRTSAPRIEGDTVNYAPVRRFFWPWSRPRTEHLSAEVKKTLQTLAREVPGLSFEAVQEFQPLRAANDLWTYVGLGLFFRRYSLGHTRLGRQLDSNTSQVLYSNVRDQDFKPSVMLSLAFDQKLMKLNEALLTGSKYPESANLVVLVKAIIADLLLELEPFISASQEAQRDLANAKKLEMLREILLKSGRENAGSIQNIWVDILGSLKAFSRAQGSFVKSYIDDLSAEILRTHFGESTEQVNRRASAKAEQISREANSRQRSEAKSRRVLSFLMSEFSLSHVLDIPDGSRRISESEYRDRVAHAAASETAWKETERRHNEQRGKYLIPGGCDALLGSVGEGA